MFVAPLVPAASVNVALELSLTVEIKAIAPAAVAAALVSPIPPSPILSPETAAPPLLTPIDILRPSAAVIVSPEPLLATTTPV